MKREQKGDVPTLVQAYIKYGIRIQSLNTYRFQGKYSEFMLEFRYKFAEFWLECFKYFKFYQLRVSLNYQPSNSNFIEFEIGVVKLVKISSFE